MGDFFGSIYCWFEDFFGVELANYLWGDTSLEQLDNMFIGIGLSMIILTPVMVVLYYYVIDHPRLSNCFGWIIFLFVNALLNFFIGWQWVLKDFYEGKMVGKDLITGRIVDLPIDTGNIVAFGFTNALISIIAFIIISFIVKWWSTNSSHVPF